MKQWKKVGVCVIPVVLAIALGLTVRQWENFKTVCTVLLDDSKAISRKMGETQHKQKENLGEAYHITVLPPSIAQSNALLNGKTSPEEVKDSLGISQVMQTIPEQEEGGTDSPQPAQTQQPAKPKLEPTKTPERSDTELPEVPEEVQTEEPELTEEERELMDDIESVKQIVAGVRTVRNQKNIAPKEALTLQAIGSNVFEQYNSVLSKMANLQAIEVVQEKSADGTAFMVGVHEFAVPLGSMIDIEAEIAKAEAQLKHLEGFLTGVRKKLQNERFVANAPEAVVALERKKESDSLEKIASLKDTIAELSKAKKQ